jgi:hypothetical protein
VIVSLHCEFPPTYPSESPPNLKIQVEKGLSANQGDEVKELADRVAQENLGAPSIFAVAEAVKEWLVDNNIAGQDGSMYSGTFFRRLFAAFSADPDYFLYLEMMRRMQQKDIQQKKQTEKAAISAAADSEFKEKIIDPAELERIRRRQEGTPVTVETFNKWKKAFEDEMAAKELEALRAGGGNLNNLAPLVAVTVGSSADSGANMKALLETLAADGRPTGKQFFLLNMGGTKGAAEGEEDPDAEDLDGPDVFAEALAASGAKGDYGGSDEGDSDYVDEGEEDEDSDDEDADYEEDDA